VLIAELEADDAASCEASALRLRAAFEAAGAQTAETALTASAEKEIWDLRHAASPILSQLTALTSMQFIEDGAVPPARLPDYIRGVRAALEEYSTLGVVFGHAGDAHVHVNPLLDLARPDWRGTVNALLENVVALTQRLGGTLAGEHGDGRLRTPLMPRAWSAAAMNAFAEMKRCFDPAGTLNPGVKVPLEGQIAIDHIKYDPALPPLPEGARAALDGVVARRAYSDFRLSLIG
jgi:FAD/FMN-containing dehydrogenase